MVKTVKAEGVDPGGGDEEEEVIQFAFCFAKAGAQAIGRGAAGRGVVAQVA